MRRLTRRLLVPALWSSLVVIAGAVPNPAVWRDESLIGSNATHYFTCLVERIQPGSHFEYIDSVYLCQFAIDDSVTSERVLLRRTVHEQPAAEPPWRTRELPTSATEVPRRLAERQVAHLFPSDDLDKYRLEAGPAGLFLSRGKTRVLLLDGKSLAKSLRLSDDKLAELMRASAQVLVYYRDERRYYFLIRYGAASYDFDFGQVIVAVPVETVAKAKKQK